MAEKRASNRVKDQRRVLDEAARKRRTRRHLELLYMDNHHEEPDVDLTQRRGLKVDDDQKKEKKQRSRNKMGGEPIKMRYKNFGALLDEERDHFKPNVRNYITAIVPPSKYPEKHFCAVCSFPSNYTCPVCGDRYCCVKCYQIHKDTRCLKWIS